LTTFLTQIGPTLPLTPDPSVICFWKWIGWKDYEVPKNHNLERVSTKNELVFSPTRRIPTLCTRRAHLSLPRRYPLRIEKKPPRLLATTPTRSELPRRRRPHAGHHPPPRLLETHPTRFATTPRRAPRQPLAARPPSASKDREARQDPSSLPPCLRPPPSVPPGKETGSGFHSGGAELEGPWEQARRR
jgi:hypothetical protein